jgi:hypothetical protein
MDQVTESVTKRETPSAAERAAAVRQKGGYIYRIDPEYDPAGRVPPEVIQGAWAVNAAGEIVGEFERNPNYHGA